MSEFGVTSHMQLGCFTAQFKGHCKHYYLQTVGCLRKYTWSKNEEVQCSGLLCIYCRAVGHWIMLFFFL